MSKQRVLVVEDDPWLRERFTRTLETSGFAVSQAAHAIEAMDCLDDNIPDVLLLDVFLPGPNGLVLLHEMRSHRDLGAIPVVIITTSADNFALKDLAPYGVVRILDKTNVHSDDVVAAVRKALI